MRQLGALAALGCLLWAGAAYAKPEKAPTGLAGLEYLATMDGQCSRLVLGGKDASSACEPHVLNEVFKSGRVGFTFVAKDGTVVSFSGQGPKQVKLDPDTVSQPLDTVILTQAGAKTPPAAAKGTGACTYTNPMKGPSHINCSARTEHGQFEAVFVSDGQPPTFKTF